jgi:hypothetical protein
LCCRSCFCANEEELLRELGVDHILNVAEECPPPPTVANRKEGEKLVKHYMMVDVVEHVRSRLLLCRALPLILVLFIFFCSQIRKSENQWNTFESCFNFIDKARVAYEGSDSYCPHDSLQRGLVLTHFGHTGKTVAVRRDGVASG